MTIEQLMLIIWPITKYDSHFCPQEPQTNYPNTYIHIEHWGQCSSWPSLFLFGFCYKEKVCTLLGSNPNVIYVVWYIFLIVLYLTIELWCDRSRYEIRCIVYNSRHSIKYHRLYIQIIIMHIYFFHLSF